MISLNQDSLVILLLCSDLGLDKDLKKRYKPYTIAQWNKLVAKLVNSSIERPSNLLNLGQDILKRELLISEDESQRIYSLLKRGGNMALEIENLWSRGIHITTRAEINYPNRFKKVLKDYAPPIIYYSGNLDLANEKLVAIVGSRDIDVGGVEFTKEIANRCIKGGYGIVSGGAKGVDSIGETNAIAKGGYAVSIVPNNMSNKIKEKPIRDSIIAKKRLVLSMVNPDARFTIYSAMGRNKYIYGLSQFAVIVSSSDNKGGTWTGAVENLKKKWVPYYVRDGEDVSIGNKKLIELGGIPINIEQVRNYDLSIGELFSHNTGEKIKEDKGMQISFKNFFEDGFIDY